MWSVYMEAHHTKRGLCQQISSKISEFSKIISPLFLKNDVRVLQNVFLSLTAKLSNRSLSLLLHCSVTAIVKSIFFHTHLYFASTYTCILWVKLILTFKKHRSFNHFYDWDILKISFFIWMHGEAELKKVMKELNIIQRTLNF